MSETVYCIDTDAIIHLLQSSPRDIFATLWDRIDVLMETGRLKIHTAVRGELTKIDWPGSEARAWMAEVPANAIIDIDNEQGAFISRVTGDWNYLRNFWGLPEQSESADPWLIALGGSKGYTVVSDEGRKTWHIPDVCSRYDIKCLHRLDWLRAEGWKF